MREIQLNCHNPECDKALIVEVNRLPSFGFELSELAKQVGWKSVIDSGQSKTFIFCSDDCIKGQKFTRKALIF